MNVSPAASRPSPALDQCTCGFLRCEHGARSGACGAFLLSLSPRKLSDVFEGRAIAESISKRYGSPLRRLSVSIRFGEGA